MALVKYQGNAHVPLVAMDNIDTFTKAAIEYGVPESNNFPSSDLYEANKATLYHVINFLNKLGCAVRRQRIFYSQAGPERNIVNDLSSTSSLDRHTCPAGRKVSAYKRKAHCVCASYVKITSWD